MTDGVMPNPSADFWQAMADEQNRIEADSPRISPGPDTWWDALKAGHIQEAYDKAKEGLRENLSPLFGPTEAQKIAEAVPVHDANGNVTYQYKPAGSEVDKRGLLPAINDAGSAMLDPVTAYQLWQDGKGITLTDFDEERQKQLLPPDPNDSAAVALWKAVHNTVLNTEHAVVNPTMLLLPESRALSGVFAADSGYTASQQAQQALQAPTLQGKIEGWLGALVSAGMAGVAGTHAVHGDVQYTFPDGAAGNGGGPLDLTQAPTEALQGALQNPDLAARLGPDLGNQVAGELARRTESGSGDATGVPDASTGPLPPYSFDGSGNPAAGGEGAAVGSSPAAKATESPTGIDSIDATPGDDYLQRGSFGGELFDRGNLEALREELAKGGITLRPDADDELNEMGMGAAFNPKTGEFLIRSNATLREVFHELGHFETWERVGGTADNYLALSKAQREVEVYENWLRHPEMLEKLNGDEQRVELNNFLSWKQVLDAEKSKQ